VDSLLIDEWLEGGPSLRILDGASVALARDLVRAEAARLGLPPEVAARLVNVVSELATNQLAHARGGEVSALPMDRAGVVGLEVCAVDRGDGIADPRSAFRPGVSTAGTLGVGLPAVTELADEVDVDVRLGEGTCLRARAFAAGTRGREVGIFATPCEGETVSGDGAVVHRSGGTLTLFVIDGLGHGPLAREATSAVARTLRGKAGAGLEAIFHACHAASEHTRGVAMTAARVEGDGTVTLMGVGNVAASLIGPKVERRFTGSAAVLGAPGPLKRIATERMTLTPYDVLALFTDGVTSRASLGDEPGALSAMPVEIAQRIIERFGRASDDALVLVAR